MRRHSIKICLSRQRNNMTFDDANCKIRMLGNALNETIAKEFNSADNEKASVNGCIMCMHYDECCLASVGIADCRKFALG